MLEIICDKYHPPTDLDTVDITLNIPKDEIKYLSSEFGHCFYSKDEIGEPNSGEDVPANIERMWQALGMKAPDKFTSLGARICKVNGAILNCYGAVVLVVKPDCINQDAVIVNGDFKGIGYKLQLGADKTIIRCCRPLDVGLGKELHLLFDNVRKSTPPRLIGNYFEARLRRPLLLDDIKTAYVGNDKATADLLSSYLQ